MGNEIKTGTLVLEGGATRGVFTSGVLDFLMEKDMYLSHVIGVSAGACNAVDYVSKQIGRTRDCMIHKEKEYDYNWGFRKFVKEKSLFDMDLLFDKFPNELLPFDFETYFNSEITCEVVTTNCITGKAEYMQEREDKDRLMKICRASSSLPLFAPVVMVDEQPYLDGGLSDSVPIERALGIGNEKIVVVLTRNPGYRKKVPSKTRAKLYRRAYSKYPNLVKAIITRNMLYNRTMNRIDSLEAQGIIFVIRPQMKTVSRTEKDYEALVEFYNHGYYEMERQYEALKEYMEK